MIPENTHTQTDEEIAALSLENAEYFAILIERYQTKLLSYIRRITAVNEHDAEDIMQEVFIKAYYHLNDFDPTLQFSSWMYRIAHNETISQFRKRKVRPQGNSIDVEQEVIAQIASDIEIDADVDQQLLKEQMQYALDQLDIKYREVLVLKFFQDKSYAEISDILRKPEGTIATLLNRAKKQLKKIVQQQAPLITSI